MSKKPTVSVVITCYNYAEYISQAIDSVLDQTFDGFEIIIVNDGSTDNTEEVIQKYISNDCIKYINQANTGQANAKNIGIKNSKGKFIAFLDADDIWEKTKLEKQIPLFSNKSVGIVYSRMRFVDDNDNNVEREKENKYLTPKSGKVTNPLFFDNFVPFSSSIVRRECFEKCSYFDESIKMGIDWDLWLRISIHYEFEFVNEPLLLYRIGHSGQMSRNLEERQNCSDRIMHRFVQNNPGLLPESVIRHAWVYTYCNRGYYYQKIDLKRSNQYYIRALKSNFLLITAYKGLTRNFINRLF